MSDFGVFTWQSISVDCCIKFLWYIYISPHQLQSKAFFSISESQWQHCCIDTVDVLLLQ